MLTHHQALSLVRLVRIILALCVATMPSVVVLCSSTFSRSERVAIGGDAYRVQWLAKESFDKADWSVNWVKEGSSLVSVSRGRLLVSKPSHQGGEATIWYRHQLPADLIVRFKAKSLGFDSDNKHNLNLISHAAEIDGSPIKYGRSGKYSEYHKFPNYIVTFVSGSSSGGGHSRVRHNPGFNLLSETKDFVKPDVEYNLVLVVTGGRIRFYINGRRVHDVEDTAPLAGGQFAIRTWNTTAWWDDIEFGRILP